MADESLLKDLVPTSPEELLARAALGTPGRLGIEVGLSEPRFAPPRGQRTPKRELALRRALGGVSYPAGREQVLSQAGAWLTRQPDLLERLATLPEITYGGEQEVLQHLGLPRPPAPVAAPTQPPDSAASANQEGSSARR
ncbi:MAG: DUF2795 domain-containing protein [Candidatus Dormibacteria bacterium]